MSRNPAGVVAPFSLLVPVVGISLAFFALNERPALLELAAAVVVISGVLLGSLKKPESSRGEPPLPEVETPQATALSGGV
jgi:O-acetylserine/cysteine efflux transporter